MKTAAQAAAAWVSSAPKATTNYNEGVQGYQGDWAGATTRQKTVMQQNLQAAWARGDWENGINRVGTQGWKQRTQDKAPNYSQGFSAGAQRQAAAIAKIMQAEANIVGSLPPRGDFNANVQRSVQVQTQLHALKGQLKA